MRCHPRLRLDSINDLQIEILGEVTPGGVVLDESRTLERCQSIFPLRDFLIQLLKVLRTPLLEFFAELREFVAQAFDDIGNDLPPPKRGQVVVRVPFQVKIGTFLAGRRSGNVEGLNPGRAVNESGSPRANPVISCRIEQLWQPGVFQIKTDLNEHVCPENRIQEARSGPNIV